MDDAGFLPTDLTECHHLLMAAYQQSVQLERRAEHAEQCVAGSEQRVAESEQRVVESQQCVVEAQQCVVEAEQQVAELDRVLDATSASFQELRQEHASTLEELAWYKRWVHGRLRERMVEGMLRP